ncbi:alkaline phosphatase [Iamia sp. SCSIO 61187]|uniref:alkaline phosphatase D family protein n=1 Tax=Iamia sp. SCSIO 61187 TaxID=2722752 RepID=UPI001C62590D|nr:alkaline phosphatase D family protein [Iamia sp. SCSIO 61187]QYG94146.1 alkaline phosphatase [Iamia sp. SCSIO 61187]
MEPIGRRSLLVGAAATVAAVRLRSLLAPLPAGAAPLPVDPFTLGVATGDPTSSGFIAWTRLAPDPTNGGGMPPDDVPVEWVVARDAAMSDVAASGTVAAVAELAHTVHVDVTGLAPDREWFVQFHVEGWSSPVGRGRTLPASGTGALRFGFVSCQKYASGYYTALRGLSEEGVDLWFHLGDYIYENAASGPVRPEATIEAVTLDDYRNRYAIYKSDPDLQAAHHAAPVIVVWDDHEVDNNYADEVGQGGQTTAQIRARRQAGYRAWFEHLPVRLPVPTGPDLQIYRGFDWGDLARFHMLDGRQYRDPAPCQVEAEANPLGLADCPARTGEDRTMLGADQRRWLADSLASSPAVWDVVGQQTVFVPLPIAGGYNTDQWDGYPQDRQRVWELLRQRLNPVILTGDIHVGGVARLHHELEDVATERIGTELVGTSVSSAASIPDELADVADEIVGSIPYIEYANVRQRGYTVVDLTADSMRYEYKVVADATVPDSAITTAHTGQVPARVAPAGPPPPDGPPTAGPAVPVTAPATFTG